MSNTKFTPGPWLHNKKFELYKKNYYSEIISGKGFFDTKDKQGFSIAGIMSDADAKLIASVPELLENLIRIIDRIEENGYHTSFTSAYERAKAAIKKATL